MVQETEQIFEYLYCGNDYEDYYDAYECAKECAPVQDPIERDIKYYCEICKDVFNIKSKAKNCEDKHKKEKDKVFIQGFIKGANII